MDSLTAGLWEKSVSVGLTGSMQVRVTFCAKRTFSLSTSKRAKRFKNTLIYKSHAHRIQRTADRSGGSGYRRGGEEER